MANEFPQVHPESDTKKGEGEEEFEVIELNLRYICPTDARLVSNFIASHGAEITPSSDYCCFNSSCEMRCSAYMFFSDLLILLKRHSLLDILDNKLYYLIHLTQELRATFGFCGPWLDALEILILDNHKNASRHMKKLMDVEKKMKTTTCFKKQRKLANLREKIKAVSDARKPLDFFYPT